MEKEKVILNLFVKFLQKIECRYGKFEFDSEGNIDSNQFYCAGENQFVSPPIPMEKFLETLIDSHLVGEISEDDLTADVWMYELKIYPDSTLMLVARGTAYGDTEETDGYYEEDIDDEIFAGLPVGVSEIEVEFNGGGDSGYIEDHGFTREGETINLPDPLTNLLYTMLEANYGGWEINEGSSGKFFIMPKEKSVSLSFFWNVEKEIEETIWEWNFAE